MTLFFISFFFFGLNIAYLLKERYFSSRAFFLLNNVAYTMSKSLTKISQGYVKKEENIRTLCKKRRRSDQYVHLLVSVF